jgi:hypothetical protein
MEKNDHLGNIDIGEALTKGIYADAKLVLNDVQPIYLLHRDTIRNFLREKRELFGLEAKLLGYFGIELSLLITILTSTFHDWGGINSRVIEAIFYVTSVFFGVKIIFDGYKWYKEKNGLDIDFLSNELGARGSATIQPIKK